MYTVSPFSHAGSLLLPLTPFTSTFTDHLSGVALNIQCALGGFKKSLSQSSHPQGLHLQRLRQRTTQTHRDNTAIRMQNTLLEHSLSARCALKTSYTFNPQADNIMKNRGFQGLNIIITDTDWGAWWAQNNFCRAHACVQSLLSFGKLCPSPTYSDWFKEWSCDSNFRVLLQELLPGNSRGNFFCLWSGSYHSKNQLHWKDRQHC